MSLKSPFIRNFASKIILFYILHLLFSAHHLFHGAIVDFSSACSRHSFDDEHDKYQRPQPQQGAAHDESSRHDTPTAHGYDSP